MAAYMTKCRFVTTCISISPKSLHEQINSRKTSRTLMMFASLHTQRRAFRDISVFTSRVFRCQGKASVGSPSLYLNLGAPALSARWNSSSTSSTSTPPEFIPPPSDYIPPAPPVPEPTSASTELMEGLNALGEPTLQSLGLGSYWPPGLVQQALEAIHVNLGLPWWGSILLFTVTLRTCMFPLVIKSQKSAIHMQNHMPTVQRLQAKFTEARQRGDMLATMRYGGELQEYMKRNDVNPMKQFMMPLAQLPVFMSMFVGLRKMANLPVESMTTGGVLWFPDLTVTEHFYGLPLLTAVTFWLTLEAGVDGVSANNQKHAMKWFLRAMPIIMIPMISNFPAAMLVYWFSSNTFSLAQVMFLKIPAIRKALDLPKPIVHPIVESEKKPFIQGFKESWSNMRASQSVAERARIDETAYRKAAQGPIIKTYKYNPKKVKSQLKLAGAKSTSAKSKTLR